MELKPIDTIYDGYKFRSRLEARWAVFFDAMGIKFEYEPQGYELPSGKLYLPDFKLHGFVGRGSSRSKVLWADVKGVDERPELDEREHDAMEKIKEFSGFINYYTYGSSERPTIILPNIPFDADLWSSADITTFEFVDGDRFGCGISRAPEPGMFELCGDDSNYWTTDQINVTEYCLSIARQARFEHGQTPRVVKV